MRLAPIRYCGQLRNASRDGLTLTLNRSLLASAPAQVIKLVQRFKSDKKASNTDCCKEPDQATNRELQPPPNCDPYHIKVPKVAVPSLPHSDAKPMLQCSKQRVQCSGERLGPPPCPPCPKKPFDWRPIAVLLMFFALMGTIYKVYLYVDVEDPAILEAKKSWRPRKPVKVPSSWKDLPKCVQYLIIGGGQAGWSAHEAILKNDPKARILFITKEDKLPYRLPAMSKWMWWNTEPPNPDTLEYVRDGTRESMYFKDCKYYVEPKKFPSVKSGPAVSVCKGWVVNRVDADDHIAWITTVEDDFPMYYERCLIATGSKARTLSLFQTSAPSVRSRVRSLRSVVDLEQAYRGLEHADHVTIVGGGALGSELAWHLGRRNELWKADQKKPKLGITQVIKDRGLLAGILPEYLSEWAVELLRCKGVNVVQQAQVYDAFPTPEGRIELTLSNGDSLITDYVIVAVGTEPRTEIAAASELEVDHENGGFLTNTEMRIRKHLFGAGDAASFFTQWKQRRLRCDHIENAAETGALAGTNMTGYWEPNNIEPHFKFFFEDKLTVEVIGEAGACMGTVGLFSPCAAADAATLEPGAPDDERPCYRKKDEYRARYKRGLVFYLQDDVVTGIVFWNLPWEKERLRVVKEILRAQPTVSDIDILADLLNFEMIKCDDETAPEKTLKMPWQPKKVKPTLCLKDVVRKYEKSGKPCKEYPKYACRNRSADTTPKVAKAAKAADIFKDKPEKVEQVPVEKTAKDNPTEDDPSKDNPTEEEDAPNVFDIPDDIDEPEVEPETLVNESSVEAKASVEKEAVV